MTTYFDEAEDRPFRPGSILKAAGLGALIALALYTALLPAAAAALRGPPSDSLAVRNERAQAALK